jgi:hypothetical protein
MAVMNEDGAVCNFIAITTGMAAVHCMNFERCVIIEGSDE